MDRLGRRGVEEEKNCLTLSCFAATLRRYEVCATSFHEKCLISTELHAGRVRDVTHVQQEDKICVRTSELGGLGVDPGKQTVRPSSEPHMQTGSSADLQEVGV